MRKKMKKNPKRINKKVIVAVIAVVAIVGGIAAFSAFEAHVINVTAHIENALSVGTTPIEFGTVFPQEYVEEEFTISLSNSFLAEDRVDDVEYVIKQKPKCICEWDPITEPSFFELYCELELYAPVDYATHQCPEYYVEMLSLCPFLSKTDGDPEDNNDIEEPSYYDPKTDTCPIRQLMPASGRLAESEQDISDIWIVDLKVPPVSGYVGQDWPAGCPVVDEDSRDYGCDLWIEVTGISETNNENNNHPEPYCGDGIINGNEQCEYDADCSTGMVCNYCQCEIENNSECTSGNTRPCYTAEPATQGVGLCHSGTQTCIGGFWSGACVGEVTPTAEVCDGLDNDCDGVTDEGNPGGGGNCNTGLFGICAAGTFTCQSGSLQCVQNNLPQAEICDGLDNNCDGSVDESLTQSCSLQLGVCAGVVQTCTSGSWSTCDYGSDYESGTELTCDGLDNNCDGQTDEGVCIPNGWTYEQNFNALSDGDLKGQDSWSGDVRFDVQTSVKYEGAKGIAITNPSGNPEIYRDFTPVTSGTYYFALRSTVTNQNLQFDIKDQNNQVAVIRGQLSSNGYIQTLDRSLGYVNLQTYNADQWYVFKITFTDADDTFSIWIHDGISWSSEYGPYDIYEASGGEFVSATRINVWASGGTYTAYFDIITPTDPTTP